jgi:hypothetical protein
MTSNYITLEASKNLTDKVTTIRFIRQYLPQKLFSKGFFIKSFLIEIDCRATLLIDWILWCGNL